MLKEEFVIVKDKEKIFFPMDLEPQKIMGERKIIL
tara:strand:- start:145 stop:249 length:105 start_codon:yes stop_codon:yes gene_type:complete